MKHRRLSRLTPWRTRLLVLGCPIALAVSLVASSSGASAAAGPRHAAATTTATTLEPPSPWRGSGPPCKVQLPEPDHIVAYGTFYTCPPKRVLFIGDSVGLTMSMEMGMDEENWGIVYDEQSILGCGFLTGMEVNDDGSWVQQSPSCVAEYNTWKADVENFKPNLVVVEMGWWDSMQHLHEGHVTQLGQGWYDAALLGRMEALVKALAVEGNPPIYFLTVPWMDPPKLPTGEANPAASAFNHDEINSLLAKAVAATQPRTKLFDISPYITPENKYELDVDGSRCRELDGVHLYVGRGWNFVLTPCGKALQKGLSSAIRQQLQG